MKKSIKATLDDALIGKLLIPGHDPLEDNDAYDKPTYAPIRPSTFPHLSIVLKATYELIVQKSSKWRLLKYVSEQLLSRNGYQYDLVLWKAKTNDYVIETTWWISKHN